MTEPILTRDKILEALTMPGLNVEASLEPREVGLLCVAIGDLFKHVCVEPRAEVPHGKRDAAPLIKTMSDIIHDQTVAMQSAIIEWRHGKGAEAGMSWIVNTLEGPGHLPDFDAPHGKHAQFWFNANQANPLPTCFCGNPSSSLWMGQGFCCDEHYREAKATYDANRIRGG